jgi:hypothetical protein
MISVQKQHDPNKGRLLACGHHVSLSVDGVVCIYSDGQFGVLLEVCGILVS